MWLIGSMPLQLSKFTYLPLKFIILEPCHYNFTALQNIPLLTLSMCFWTKIASSSTSHPQLVSSLPLSPSPSENDITNAAQPPAWPHASTARHAARVRCSVTRPAWTHAGSSCRMNARHMPSSAAGLSQLGWVGQSWRLWRSG